MAVYVDDTRNPFGRMIMCHMWADTDEELHAFAEKIGLKREWFQQPPAANWKHYDISMTKRVQAVQAGAIEADRFAAVEALADQTNNPKLAEMARRARRRHRRNKPVQEPLGGWL